MFFFQIYIIYFNLLLFPSLTELNQPKQIEGINKCNLKAQNANKKD